MKSYTDLEQSKKLAEILPIETADMYWLNRHIDLTENKYELFVVDKSNKHIDFFNSYAVAVNKGEIIPCWSLAALISIIPQELFDGEYIINITEGCDNKWILTYDHHENRNHSYYGLSTGADNLVDACTDIIIKLKERNII